MGKGEHIIRKWTFDVQYTDKDNARYLHDKFSSLFNLHLSAAAEAVIDRVLSPAESVWISQLEIDLGTLPYVNFEQDIIRLLPEALEKALRERIAKADQHHDAEEGLHFHTEADRYYALVGHYLRSGSLPWWALPEEGGALDTMLLALIADNPGRFAAFITNIAQQDYILRRIAWHFSRNVVQRIITSLEEAQATFILGYITGVITLHNRQPLIQNAQSEFERAVWLFVLTYLVTDNSGQFNRKQFIRRNLERLARHFNVDYFHLLYIFRKAIDAYKQYIPSDSFVTFIQVLYEENEAAGLHSQGGQALVVMPHNAYEQVVAPRLLPLPGGMHSDLPLPLLWINYDTIVSKEDREEVWEQAVVLFRAFISGQPLPVWFSRLQAGRQDVLLKQAVILLFRKRPLLLASMWEQPVYRLQARLEVHRLFDRPVTPLEENIRKQLQAYAEQDTIQFLQQALPHTFIQHRNSFREIWLQYQQRSHTERLAFYRNILAPVAVLQQVALHTTEDDFWHMMRDALPLLWGNHTITALKEWQGLMESLLTDNLERERIRLLFRRFNLLWLSGKVQVNNSDDYINHLARFIGSYDETTMHKLMKAIVSVDVGAVSSFTQIRTSVPVLQQATAAVLKTSATQAAVAEEQQTLVPARRKEEITTADMQEERPYESLFGRKQPIAGTAEQAVTIQNAGLVLLHPFFHTYFSRLELLSGGKFVSEMARQKAVRLLQLLVDDGKEQQEHALLLNKTLCNMPWEEPLLPDIEITDTEKALARSLIGAAIQQWPKMHNSSVDSFRASFLQREGRLWQTEEAWFLHVQQRSYDIILQTLPWSYGMMRFAWLPKMLYTEWTIT
ncbi:contractile injection system tape measure protein [Chitinophaga filiformis]|uniref:Contractile injection system tape measure protein n=1 Tax=Chitinophaga filiformis TaxID=104663 RepID=A0ABY4HVB9_CHIFI|nr:contractile injection system tape measure protein [Chitinophaga filiformis]UPK66974.1 contractile injection system tape measure protein [Chitinophaga filiformis]